MLENRVSGGMSVLIPISIFTKWTFWFYFPSLNSTYSIFISNDHAQFVKITSRGASYLLSMLLCFHEIFFRLHSIRFSFFLLSCSPIFCTFNKKWWSATVKIALVEWMKSWWAVHQALLSQKSQKKKSHFNMRLIILCGPFVVKLRILPHKLFQPIAIMRRVLSEINVHFFRGPNEVSD